MKKVVFILFLLPVIIKGQTSGQVLNWNYVATLPTNYNSSTISYPTLIFFPGLGEIGTNINALVSNGPHALINSGINPLPNWIIISLQPPTAYPQESSTMARISALKQLYRIDAGRVNLTGLSHGGWMASTYVSNMPTANQVNCVVTVQGVVPDDNSPYPQGFQYFIGRNYLCFEQINDARGGDQVVNYINTLHPGRAVFIQTTFGGGGHCCWANFYGGPGTSPGRFAALSNSTLYEVLEANNKLSVLGIDTTRPQQPSQPLPFYFDANYIYCKVNITTDWALHNIVGQVVRNGSMRSGSNKIPLNGLPPGMYYLTTQFDRRYKIYKWAN